VLLTATGSVSATPVAGAATSHARELRRLDPSPSAGGVSILADVEARDHALVARLVAGDDDAIGEAFDRHAAFVPGVARRIAGSTSVAKDVVQEVFAALWRNPERLDPSRGSLRTYVGVLARRRAVDAIRRDSRRRLYEERREMLDQRDSGIAAPSRADPGARERPEAAEIRRLTP